VFKNFLLVISILSFSILTGRAEYRDVWDNCSKPSFNEIWRSGRGGGQSRIVNHNRNNDNGWGLRRLEPGNSMLYLLLEEDSLLLSRHENSAHDKSSSWLFQVGDLQTFLIITVSAFFSALSLFIIAVYCNNNRLEINFKSGLKGKFLQKFQRLFGS